MDGDSSFVSFFSSSSSGIWVRMRKRMTPARTDVPKMNQLTGMESKKGMPFINSF